MLRQIERHPLYFSLITATLTISLVSSILYSKLDSFIFLNGFHAVWLDTFFTYYTFLGDGLLFIAIAILFVVFGKRKKAATLLIGYVSSGCMAQAMKRIFHSPRPKVYLESISFPYLHFVPGVTTHGSNAFPSGHTTSVFCLITVLILIFKKRKICLPCLICAILVAYSRIYLAQHFLQDVTAGAFLGVLSGMLSYHFIYNQKVLKPIKRFYKGKKYIPSGYQKVNPV